MPTKLFTLIAATLLVLTACQKEPFERRENTISEEELAYLTKYPVLNNGIDNYQTSLPAHLTRTGLKAHPVSDTKATLGRVLFYDKNLSKDRSVSCASCHKQERGFADTKAFSTGVFGRQTARNSMALGAVVNYSAYHSVALNGAGAAGFFWDDRVDNVADQTKATLLNSHEMDIEMPEVVARVKALPYYNWLFARAYGDPEATEERVLSAISEFINAMGSYRSRFDQIAEKVSAADLHKPLPGLTIQENRGWGLYLNFCSGCHGVELGKPAVLMANNGLEMEYTDQGLSVLTGKQEDVGVFKVPGLRNIAMTAPYMHDGRFNTLDEVLQFYSREVQPHPNLHPEMLKENIIMTSIPIQEGGWGTTSSDTITIKGSLVNHLNLSNTDIQALKAFLLTLSDGELRNDQRFSDPFR